MCPLRAVLPAAAAAMIVLLAGSLYILGYREQYYALAEAWGAAPFRTPFLDTHGVTAAVECHRLGYDVYVHNPCDVFGRVHAYSPLWLWLSVFPITTAWDNVVGSVFVVLFIAALPLLPPGRNWQQTLMITLATVSSTTMFALERANIDVLIFVMAMMVVALTERRWCVRIVGYGVALLSGLLKFYPIVLLILALRERLAVCIAIWATALAWIALWFAFDMTEILRSIANIPSTHPFDDNVFGAHNLPFGLVALASLPHFAGVALQSAMLAAVAMIALALARLMPVGLLTRQEAAYLLIGCALMVSCFVIAQNVAYRGIYFLFVLPALTALPSPARGFAWIVVLLLWSSGLRRVTDAMSEWIGVSTASDGPLHLGVWLCRELAWWAVITLLAALLFRLICETPVVQKLRNRTS